MSSYQGINRAKAKKGVNNIANPAGNPSSYSFADEEETVDVFKLAEQKKVIKTYSTQLMTQMVFQPKTAQKDPDEDTAQRQRECQRHLQILRSGEESDYAEDRKAAQKEELEKWLNSLKIKSSSPSGAGSHHQDGGHSNAASNDGRHHRRSVVHHHDSSGTASVGRMPASSSMPLIPPGMPDSIKEVPEEGSSNQQAPSGGSRPKGSISFHPSVVEKGTSTNGSTRRSTSFKSSSRSRNHTKPSSSQTNVVVPRNKSRSSSTSYKS